MGKINTLLIISFIMTLMSCMNTAKTNDYTGVWESKWGNNSFQIRISQSENFIKGQYCAVMNKGDRMDCDFDDINNLEGVVKQEAINIYFYSFFGAINGKAILTPDGNNIKWEIVKWPEGGDCYAPETTILIKIDE